MRGLYTYKVSTTRIGDSIVQTTVGKARFVKYEKIEGGLTRNEKEFIKNACPKVVAIWTIKPKTK